MFERHDTLTDKFVVVFVYLAMVGLIFIMVYPFWDQLVMSLSMREAALRGGFRLWTWPLNFESYKMVLRSRQLFVAFGNSIYRVAMGTTWTLFITSLTAYPLSRDNMPLRGLFTGMILFTMLFSGGLIPSYLLRRDLHLLDKRLVLILPGLGAWNIIIMRNFFRSIPHEVQESASLDGASDFRTFLSIVLPLSKPVLATVALWTAVGHWNDFFGPLIYISDKNKVVLQQLLRRVLLESEFSHAGIQPGPELGDVMNKRPTDEMAKAALLMVTTVPIVLVYPFVQRYFIKGIMLGAVKG